MKLVVALLAFALVAGGGAAIAGTGVLSPKQERQAFLDDALARVGNIIGPDKSAKKARGLFNEEAKKTFLGEPYERVMAYFYRGILYWMNGAPDNARACFRIDGIQALNSAVEAIRLSDSMRLARLPRQQWEDASRNKFVCIGLIRGKGFKQ